MINIEVNGEAWQVPPAATVTDLLSRIKISPKVCVVERNGTILDRKSYNEETVRAGDRFEVIRMMGGG